MYSDTIAECFVNTDKPICCLGIKTDLSTKIFIDKGYI